ncbi:MAG: SBBP repeat-containing protein, partial [Planctomycetota bacterium]
LKEQLVGGNISEIKGGAKSTAIVSYFTGNDPSKWQSAISTYEIVDMGEVYEGIGLRLKAFGNNVEKLFTVRPSANHETIRIKLAGAQELTVNESGELVAETELGAVKFTKPVAYQEIDGQRVEVECNYTIAEWVKNLDFGIWNLDCFTIPHSAFRIPQLEYGFTVASYDKTKDLIIDPLLASTYLGGVFEDHGKAITVDADGNVFVTGETLSSDFPTTPGAYDTSRKGNTDVIVSKFNGDLTSLLASTFLGGPHNHDRGCSIAIDAGGNVYVAGTTYSTDFPTTRGSYDTAGNGRWDVFVSKFDNGLTKLLASTFLGKSSDEYGYSIAIDAGGNVYVTGETLSFDFPTTPGAYRTAYNGGYYDAFVSKFNSGLTSLLASTFLGGGSGDYGRAIAVDGVGNVFVAGNTWSKDFPATPGVYNTAHNGGNDDAFVSKLNNGLTSLLASTYLGGYSNDCGKAIAVDGGGNVYVTGDTVSPNFPTTAGAYATSYNRGSKDVFISKFDNGLTSLSASTLLGGHANDYGKAIAIDAGGYVYVAGSTSSKDFPTTPGAYDTSPNGDSDIFVSKFNSGLANLIMSTLQGGSRSDFGNSMTVGPGGYVYVVGETLSLDFPTTPGAYDTSYHRCEDIFVSRFNVELSVDKAGK